MNQRSVFRFALRSPWLPVLAAGCAVLGAGADEVHFQLMSSGAMQRMGGYMPQRINLSTARPGGLKKVPAGLTAPLYGDLKLGPAEAPSVFYIVLDEPGDKPARLFVGKAGETELSEGSQTEWKASTSQPSGGKKLTMYSGDAMFELTADGQTQALHVPMYRFDKNDPQRVALASNLFYYSDYARTGELTLSGKSYPAMLLDDGVTGDFRGKPGLKNLILDLNHDGKFDRRREAFDPREPFNVGGTTYEIQSMGASGACFQLVKSEKNAPETKPPADLAAGQKAILFEAKTTDGSDVNFPAKYKGELVMLDFWATWCGPCRGELPHLTKAYEQFHDKGFEVLGVSLDQSDQEAKLAQFTKDNHMPWAQIYDGKYWQARVAQLYDIDSIPRAFLVDGDTGLIVATGEKLRGEALSATVEKALATKQAK